MNIFFKEKAINLRRLGYSYSEIQEIVPVSHASLSRWLRTIQLSASQKDRLRKKMQSSIAIAHKKAKAKRIEKTKKIENKAMLDIHKISQEELIIIGAILYWAEGAKQKDYDVSQGVCFSNSDPLMIKLFLLFLSKSVKIAPDEIDFDLYIHENHNNRASKARAINHWINVTGFQSDKFGKIYFKKNKISGNRKNKESSYFGLLRVKVKRSTNLNRKINGWVKGIILQCGIV